MHAYANFQNYYVGSYRSAQAIVVVEHSSGLNNVYLSDDSGIYYTLSLDNVVLDPDQGLDFELVSNLPFDLKYMFWLLLQINSMNGTFIANQFVRGTNGEVRTLITFDNGVEWKLMEAPEVDFNQEVIECELVCE